MKMDIVVSKLHGNGLKTMQIILALLGVAYSALLLVFGWKYALAAFVKGTKANSTFASPLWPSYMALPLGSLGLTLEYILEIIETALSFKKTDDKPAADETAADVVKE